MLKKSAISTFAAALCVTAGSLSASEIWVDQNFDDASYKAGPMIKDWEGKKTVGGWKKYSDDNFYIVNSPAASKPNALKIVREGGGATICFRNFSIPAGKDFSIAMKVYIPKKNGGLLMWFTDGKQKTPIGGLLMSAGNKTKCYIPHEKTEYVWMQTNNSYPPTDKFFDLRIDFNAASKIYTYQFERNGVPVKSVDYPFLIDAPLQTVNFMTLGDKGTWCVIDDLKITYSREESKPLQRSILNTKMLDQTPPAFKRAGKTVRFPRITELKPPLNQKQVYGVNFPFQLGPDIAAAFVNRNIYGDRKSYDSEDGTDIIIFDSLDGLEKSRKIPINRSGVFKDISAGGKERWHNRYPCGGGFVPYGAKLNGKPHPFAGTGFAINHTVTHPVAPNGTFDWSMGNMAGFVELHQLSYDGKDLKIVSQTNYLHSQPLKIGDTGYYYNSGGMNMAIPDGEDLLCAANIRDIKTQQEYCAVVRWKNINGKWMPTDCVPIAFSDHSQEHNYYEPALIRDNQGNLVFSARDDGRINRDKPHWGVWLYQDLNLWVSKDGGKTFEHTVRVNKVRTGPVVLCRSADAQIFLISNPALPNRTGTEKDTRARSYMWVVSKDYQSVYNPVTLRDLKAEFGQDKDGYSLIIDHPTSNVLRLKDGKLYGVVSYRIRDAHTDNGTPHEAAGSYIDVITSGGAARPVWEF